MALEILLNAKTQRPSVCNAVETLLVHADIADAFLPQGAAALAEAGVTVHGDARVGRVRRRWCRRRRPTSPTEYLSLDIAASVVDSLDAALHHIRRYSTGHSETIITESQTRGASGSPPRSTRRRCW